MYQVAAHVTPHGNIHGWHQAKSSQGWKTGRWTEFGNRRIRSPCRVAEDSSEKPVSENDGFSSSSTTSKDAILARIEKAKKYKAGKVGTNSVVPQAGGSGSSVQELDQIKSVDSRKSSPEDGSDSVLERFDAYAVEQASRGAEDYLTAQKEMENQKFRDGNLAASPGEVGYKGEMDNRGFRVGSGNENVAATWLQTISSQDSSASIDQNLRAEEFSEQKEAIRRNRGATIERGKGNVSGTRRQVYVEDGYGLAQQQDEAEASIAAERSKENLKGTDEEDDLHKPKVATWGVFPRPRNISEAYGGGRNIKPGETLESKEDASKREERIAKALQSYRRSVGIEIEPHIETRATNLYNKGQELMDSGALNAALEIFQEAAEMVPLRSNIGGQINLKLAICLDSMGKNEEAYSIYKKLKGHNAPGVSKTSQRMLFGFSAAKNLKVSTMDFSGGGREAWESYFDKVRANAYVAYRTSNEENAEDEASVRNATFVAAAVVLVPLALCVALILEMQS